MSILLMARVWELELRPDQQLLLLALADHADDEGYCYPSVARLAWKLGKKERAVQYGLRDLEAGGVVLVVGHRDGGRGKAREYRIDLSAGPRKPPFTREETVQRSAPYHRETVQPTASFNGQTVQPAAPYEQETVQPVAPMTGEKGATGRQKRVQPDDTKGATGCTPTISNHQVNHQKDTGVRVRTHRTRTEIIPAQIESLITQYADALGGGASVRETIEFARAYWKGSRAPDEYLYVRRWLASDARMEQTHGITGQHAAGLARESGADRGDRSGFAAFRQFERAGVPDLRRARLAAGGAAADAP